MALADVERAIVREAHTEAQAQRANARAEADAILANAREQIALEQQRFDMQTRQLLEDIERRELARAAAIGKAIELDARREALEHAFAQAHAQIISRSATARAAILEALLARAERELPDIAKVFVHSADVASAQRLAPHATIIIDNTISAGLRAEDSSGRIRSDLTVESALATVRERELPLIARELFSA